MQVNMRLCSQHRQLWGGAITWRGLGMCLKTEAANLSEAITHLTNGVQELYSRGMIGA